MDQPALSIDDPVTAEWLAVAIRVLQHANTSTCVVGVDVPVAYPCGSAAMIISAIMIPTEHAERSCQAMTSLHREIIEGSRLLRNR